MMVPALFAGAELSPQKDGTIRASITVTVLDQPVEFWSDTFFSLTDAGWALANQIKEMQG